MFLVPTYVGPSAIHGMGCFAKEKIFCGTIVWRFISGIDIVITDRIYRDLGRIEKEYVDTYAWRSVKTNRLILGVDNDRFVNHSDSPNTLSQTVNSEPEIITIAIKDIEPGEEITDDYSSFEGKVIF